MSRVRELMVAKINCDNRFLCSLVDKHTNTDEARTACNIYIDYIKSYKVNVYFIHFNNDLSSSMSCIVAALITALSVDIIYDREWYIILFACACEVISCLLDDFLQNEYPYIANGKLNEFWTTPIQADAQFCDILWDVNYLRHKK